MILTECHVITLTIRCIVQYHTFQVPQTSDHGRGGIGLLSAFRTRSSDALDVGPNRMSSPDRLEHRKGSPSGMLGLLRSNKSGDALDDGPSNKGWLRQNRKKSMSDGVQLMSNIGDLHLLSSRSSSPTSASSASRLSAAAAQQLGSAEEDESSPIDATLFQASLDRPSHHGQERRGLTKSLSENVAFMRAMNTDDPFTLHSAPQQPKETLPPQQEEIDHNDINGSLGNGGMEVGSGMRPRSNSTDATMMQNIGKSANDAFFQQPEPSLGRVERKQRRRIMKTQSEGVAQMRLSLANDLPRLPLDSTNGRKPSETLAALSELTQLSAKVRR